MAGRDVLVVMPTGAGKSLCYQLPALEDTEALTLVVSPLVSLMQDQVEGLGDRARADQRAAHRRRERRVAPARARAARLRMLYVAPERFWAPRHRREAKGNVGLFVVDEAHCVSQWGHDFRPEYYKLGEIAKRLEARSILAATATATPRVSVDIINRLGLDDPVRIAHRVRAAEPLLRRRRRSRAIAPASGPSRRSCRSPTRCPRSSTRARASAPTRRRERLSRELGHPVPAYHAGMDREPRAEAQRRVHVRRVAGGRGDERVRHGRRQGGRAHRDPRGGAVIAGGLLPGGRARGPRRAPSRCVLLASGQDKGLHVYFINQTEDRGRQVSEVGAVPRGLGLRRRRGLPPGRDPQALRRPLGSGVRRPLLRLLRRAARDARVEKIAAPPKRTHASGGDEDIRDAILRVVEEASPSVGRTRAVEILRGGRSKVVVKYAYDELPGYGEWNEWRAEELLGEVDAMLAAGVIRSTGGKFPKLEAAIGCRHLEFRQPLPRRRARVGHRHEPAGDPGHGARAATASRSWRSHRTSPARWRSTARRTRASRPSASRATASTAARSATPRSRSGWPGTRSTWSSSPATCSCSRRSSSSAGATGS